MKRVRLILHLGGVTIYCEAGRVVASNAGLRRRTELKDSFIAGLAGTRTLARKRHRNHKTNRTHSLEGDHNQEQKKAKGLNTHEVIKEMKYTGDTGELNLTNETGES